MSGSRGFQHCVDRRPSETLASSVRNGRELSLILQISARKG